MHLQRMRLQRANLQVPLAKSFRISDSRVPDLTNIGPFIGNGLNHSGCGARERFHDPEELWVLSQPQLFRIMECEARRQAGRAQLAAAAALRRLRGASACREGGSGSVCNTVSRETALVKAT